MGFWDKLKADKDEKAAEAAVRSLRAQQRVEEEAVKTAQIQTAVRLEMEHLALLGQRTISPSLPPVPTMQDGFPTVPISKDPAVPYVRFLVKAEFEAEARQVALSFPLVDPGRMLTYDQEEMFWCCVRHDHKLRGFFGDVSSKVREKAERLMDEEKKLIRKGKQAARPMQLQYKNYPPVGNPVPFKDRAQLEKQAEEIASFLFDLGRDASMDGFANDWVMITCFARGYAAVQQVYKHVYTLLKASSYPHKPYWYRR